MPFVNAPSLHAKQFEKIHSHALQRCSHWLSAGMIYVDMSRLGVGLGEEELVHRLLKVYSRR